MAKGLTAAQRRAVADSDPATGRLSARPEVCMALTAAGLAVPHGRGGHHSYYLTGEGLRLRAEAATARPADAPAEPAPAADSRGGGSFTADDGTGTGPPPAARARRAAEVESAWAGLLRIRAVLLDGETALPAPWERERCVHAVSLALEAAGCPPAGSGAPGYRVTPAAERGMAEIHWSPAGDRQALAECARVLDAHGWQSTGHRTRAGDPYLLTTPRRR